MRDGDMVNFGSQQALRSHASHAHIPHINTLQCDKVAIMKDGDMVYFGPPDAAALAEHLTPLPVVDSLADATVEGKESVVAPAKAEVSRVF